MTPSGSALPFAGAAPHERQRCAHSLAQGGCVASARSPAPAPARLLRPQMYAGMLGNVIAGHPLERQRRVELLQRLLRVRQALPQPGGESAEQHPGRGPLAADVIPEDRCVPYCSR